MYNFLRHFYHQGRNFYHTFRFHRRQSSINKKTLRVEKLQSEKLNVINKIGFYVYTDLHLAHLLPIAKHLPKGTAEFITPEIEEIPKCFDNIEFPFHCSLDFLAASKKYRCVVSLYMQAPSWFKKEKTSPQKKDKNLGSSYFKCLGENHVRMQYSLGAMPLNIKDYMKSYDSLFVYGPHDEKIYREKLGEGKNIYQVGYPKFDRYFSDEMPEVECKGNLNDSLKTILWLPTYDSLSSIPKYLDTMLKLTENFNVILKPHPLDKTHLLERIKKSPIILSEYHDSAPFYKLADIVFCDYGGSSFGALYCKKPIVFLSPDNPEIKMSKYSPNSPELILRKHLLTLNNEKPQEILQILQNSDYLVEDSKTRTNLRSKFFMNNFGVSGKTAANHLLKYCK